MSMKCLECNENESLKGSAFCKSCKKKRDEIWNTCKTCGVKDGEHPSNWVMDSECRICRKKREDELDFAEAEENGTITRDDSIMCPHCGYVNEEVFEEHDSKSWTCPNCEKESDLSVEYTTHFTTTKTEE